MDIQKAPTPENLCGNSTCSCPMWRGATLHRRLVRPGQDKQPSIEKLDIGILALFQRCWLDHPVQQTATRLDLALSPCINAVAPSGKSSKSSGG